jgi:hypothetical protein
MALESCWVDVMFIGSAGGRHSRNTGTLMMSPQRMPCPSGVCEGAARLVSVLDRVLSMVPDDSRAVVSSWQLRVQLAHAIIALFKAGLPCLRAVLPPATSVAAAWSNCVTKPHGFCGLPGWGEPWSRHNMRRCAKAWSSQWGKTPPVRGAKLPLPLVMLVAVHFSQVDAKLKGQVVLMPMNGQLADAYLRAIMDLLQDDVYLARRDAAKCAPYLFEKFSNAEVRIAAHVTACPCRRGKTAGRQQVEAGWHRLAQHDMNCMALACGTRCGGACPSA